MLIVFVAIAAYAASSVLTAVSYFTLCDRRRVHTASSCMFLLAALGCLGVTVSICAYHAEVAMFDDKTLAMNALADLAFFMKIEGIAIATGLGIGFLSFIVGHGKFSAVFRIFFSAAWAMLAVLLGVVATEVAGVSDLSLSLYMITSGIGASAMMALPASFDMRRLHIEMGDEEFLRKRIDSCNERAKKRQEKKNIAAHRRRLKKGKESK